MRLQRLGEYTPSTNKEACDGSGPGLAWRDTGPSFSDLLTFKDSAELQKFSKMKSLNVASLTGRNYVLSWYIKESIPETHVWENMAC